ncbi:ABC transporter ATP-binding protein [Microbacterium capsulatum]|uniref:ABC transporter ATP-binding protein n=1 Tax=Microbacterium capsulatum TaxID=3041921 RepID=A0ABU0XH52_9MICO|nr:ABC transporter ATP-binding protein [Microbacterium sp. ASV81]MDQ4214453.1 ABC transporter ATP-binding protein [Microbacterium sp. ASV81]
MIVSDSRTRPAATLEFRDVRRSFGAAVALDGLSLELVPGEMLALLGPSGCGKTTALRMVAGFEQPDSGAVLLDGRDVSATPAHRRDVGMVFQSYSLFPHLTAAENVAFGMRMRGMPSAKRRQRAHELLELVGLPAHGGRLPRQLSGGQQQRVALARALALEPRVLLLDEPLSALDAQVRQALRDEIRRLQQELGITTLFVTHDQEEALCMSDRVAVMRGGRLEQCATPHELYEAPATPFVAGFVGAMNRLPGRITRRGIEVESLGATYAVRHSLSGTTPRAGVEVDLLVRPERVRLTPDPAGPLRVVAASFLGATVRVTARTDDGREVIADVPAETAGALGIGASVVLALPDAPVLIDVPSAAAVAA